ncbi:MAG: ATP-binding protein [Pirellulaceae bacterium]
MQRISIQRYRNMLSPRLSVKIGCIVVAATVCIAMVVATAASGPAWLQSAHAIQLFWLLPILIAAFAGLLSMRACRVATSIESELLRAGESGSWRKARPLVSSGPLAEGWNALLEQACGRSQCALPESENSGHLTGTNHLMARALRSLPMGVAITDMQGSIRTANLPLVALVGAEDIESIEQTSIYETLSLTSLPDSQDAEKRLDSNARSVTLQLRRGAETGDGVLRVTRNRLAGRDGDADGFVWLIQDITQQVISLEARDQFLNTASHELRTPLANLKAYAETLAIAEGIDVEQQKEFCNIINDESTRLARLVDELLAVGQMEAGSMVLNRSDIEFSRVLQEAIDYIRPNLEKKHQHLEVDISPKLPIYVGDKDKLQAAIINLLGNAVKYTPDEGEVRLRASCTEEGLCIEVQDTGIGISADDIDKVFDKFYRATDTRVANETGNGLGLAFAREIVRRHGGDLTVQSELNSGSTFVMLLPAQEKPRNAGRRVE